MPADPKLVMLVSQLHALACAENNDAVRIVCELAAEHLYAQGREVVPDQQSTTQPDASPPAMYSPPGGDNLELKQELNQARLSMAARAHELEQMEEERGKKASAARDAQKRYRESLKKRNGKRKRKSDVRDEGGEQPATGDASG